MPEIYRANTQLKIRLSDLHEAIDEGITLPDSIASVDVVRSNGRVRIETEPTDDDVGRYTPTATLKGKINERIVIVENGEPTYETIQDRKDDAKWRHLQDEDLDVETTTVEYVKFSGWDDDFLVNEVLRYPMFEVLCQLVDAAHDGFVQGIIADEGTLSPVRFEAENGEADVAIAIEKKGETQAAESKVSW